ncbi:MAG: TIGR03435 family protein [Bryobacteraceae bacterium]|jgi:uncharacterized protein (TIGR03435 family)
MTIFLRSTIALSAICAIASLTAADEPKFEAASVKRTDQCISSNSLGPGTVILKGDPLKPILMEAFNLRRYQIVGPSWLDEYCFEIFGRVPEGVAKDRIPAMLQALLVERFKLASHKEDRPSPVYALIVDKNGPKFKEADSTSQRPGVPPGAVMFRFGAAGFKGAMTMASLALRLSNRLDHPVQDFTGLKGTYDIDLSWTPDPAFERPAPNPGAFADAHPNADLPPAPAADLLTAIRESLGLRLEPRKEPVEVLVIDHIERVPTEN